MSVTWNPFHGCHKLSDGCRHCYMYRRDAEYGKDSSVVTKTAAFNLPVRRSRNGAYKIPRFFVSLPEDWGTGYENVHISCTCESQYTADRRLPVFLKLPVRHKSITHEPMLQRINIRPYLEKYGNEIESVSCGGESGPEARPCDYAWVLDTMLQCVEYNVSFFFHQTGANFIKEGIRYRIDRKYQHSQAAAVISF